MAAEILYEWGGANLRLFFLLNGFGGDGIEMLMSWGTVFGSFRMAAPFALLIAFLAYRDQVSRDLTSRTAAARVRATLAPAAVFLFALVVAAAAVHALKTGVALPRPMERLEGIARVIAASYDDPFSFPSGHAAFAAVVACAFWSGVRSRYWQAAAAGYALWIGISRIGVGAHFPADVAAGYVIGGAVHWLSRAGVSLVITLRADGVRTAEESGVCAGNLDRVFGSKLGQASKGRWRSTRSDLSGMN